MKNCCCCSIKSCCTSLLIIISYFWLFKLYLRSLHSDYRVQQIGLIQDLAFKESAEMMTLKKIDTSFKMYNFELIEMANRTAIHSYTEQAILIISSSQNSIEGSYAHLLQKIQTSNQNTDNLGYYIIRKLKNIVLNTPKQVKIYTQQISSLIQYLIKNMMVQKLTILSFEEGSLLTLKAISILDFGVYPMISKVILINAFSPFLMIYHGNTSSFLQQTKNSILNDPQRTKLINQTRIIIIDTVGKNQLSYSSHLNLQMNDGSLRGFANTLTISTRFIWNVYCHLKPQQYFKFQPFLWILTKLFNQDRSLSSHPLSIKQLQYILLFRELPLKKQMTIPTRARMLKNCRIYYLEEYKIFGEIFKDECIRVIRKTDAYFNINTTILVKSQGKIEIYGDQLERLAPADTKGQNSLYLLQNVFQYRKIHIINRRKRNVVLEVAGIHQPNQNIHEKFIDQYSLSSIQTIRRRQIHRGNPKPVLICPGYTLLYPTHFYFHYKMASPAHSFNIQALSGQCFKGDDYFYDWIFTLAINWSLGANLIVFSLFCSHILKNQTFSRFYFQLVINSLLTFFHSGDFYFTQNILLISFVVLIEQVINLMVLLSEFLNMPRKFSAKIMWPPLIFELLRYYDPDTYPSPWKVLGLQFLAATHRQNATILFLQFAYIIDYISLDVSNWLHLSLICSWLSVSAYQSDESQKQTSINSDLIVINTGKRLKSFKKMVLKLRKELVNSVTLCLISMCLSEDGIVMHYIINFYIVAHVLFALHGLFDEYIS